VEHLYEIDHGPFLAAMRDYVEKRIDVDAFQYRIFALMKQRANMPDEAFTIIQQVFVKADDYDPVVRTEHTVTEPELLAFVEQSLAKLHSMGCC
jgi:self-protective colicin-like immunity protein